MACNTPFVALKQLRRSSCAPAAARGDMACNALPYKIAAARDAHLLATPFAGDAHEPRRERGEGFVESLSAGR
jgi:hypothetical protein